MYNYLKPNGLLGHNKTFRGVLSKIIVENRPDSGYTEQVLNYVQDLKSLLSKGTFMEQKSFLRSFIRSIDFDPRSNNNHLYHPYIYREMRFPNEKFYLLD